MLLISTFGLKINLFLFGKMVFCDQVHVYSYGYPWLFNLVGASVGILYGHLGRLGTFMVWLIYAKKTRSYSVVEENRV